MHTKKRNKDPRYANCVRHQHEFGRAGKGGKLFRMAFSDMIRQLKTPDITGRLTGEFLRVVQSDPVNDYGERTIQAGNLALLRGFEFDKKNRFNNVFYGQCDVAMDRSTGRCIIQFSSIDLTNMLWRVNGASHFIITAGAALLDFENNTYSADIKNSGMLQSTNPKNFEIQLTLPKQSALPLIVVLGISFHKIVNKVIWPVCKYGPMAMKIVKTDQVTVASSIKNV